MKRPILFKGLRFLVWCGCAAIFQPAVAQDVPGESDTRTVPLNDMSAFKPAADNWRIAGGVSADRNQKEALNALPGKGMLVNIPTEKKHDNLVSVMEHGDLELDLDFMMAKGSNSGIYLQGRYEIQLLDSWGVKTPGVHDCGSIYERWDDSKPEGQKGYQGHAPRVNVSRAPGLWQHYHISFQAPRFNAQGQKTQNARILEIVQNGVTIHENVELLGPTRGPLAPNEVAVGPLLIQGDHGPVAFRNIRYKNYDKAPLALSDLKYSYYGKFDRDPDFSKLKADAEGTTPELTWEVTKTPNDFVLRYTGQLKVTEPGEYHFYLFNAGRGRLKVANQTLVDYSDGQGSGAIKLTAGDQPVEIVYAKEEPWYGPALGLFVEGPGIRRQPLHIMSSVPMREPVDPIMLNATGTEPTMLRSFMDYKRETDAKSHRITHAISVGNPAGVHYTMDLDNGALAQVWRGSFLNTTPMWHDRGDGSSRPMGSVVMLNDAPLMQVLTNPNATWVDTLGTEAAYRFKGYDIDENGRPVFKYNLYGAEVEDLTIPEDDGKMLTRNLKVSGPNVANLYVRLADGKDILQLPDGTYSVNSNEYYLKVDGNTKPTLRTVNNRKELLMPLSGASNVKYSVIF